MTRMSEISEKLKRCLGTDEPLDYEMREFWNWIPNVKIK